MAVTQLVMRRFPKPWGRHVLSPQFDDSMICEEPIGEIWFEAPDRQNDALLVKYLFTGGPLSVQVHPTDAFAQSHGLPYGKDEAWVVVDAEPEASVGIGTRRVMPREELMDAARDGTIERHLSWHSVREGDAFYIPAGTIHAIGGGLTLVEVQTNVDVTYRLWDYNRDRPLQMTEGAAVVQPVPYVASQLPMHLSPGREVMCVAPRFILERWTLLGAGRLVPSAEASKLWLVPLQAGAVMAEQKLDPGTVWTVDEPVTLDFAQGSQVLIAYPNDRIVPDIWQPFA